MTKLNKGAIPRLTQEIYFTCSSDGSKKINRQLTLKEFDSQSQLTLYIAQTEELVKKLAYDSDRYKGGYHILMEYFDSIPDDDKQDVDKKLMKLNL